MAGIWVRSGTVTLTSGSIAYGAGVSISATQYALRTSAEIGTRVLAIGY